MLNDKKSKFTASVRSVFNFIRAACFQRSPFKLPIIASKNFKLVGHGHVLILGSTNVINLHSQDLWSILTKDSSVDEELFWKLDLSDQKLTLLQVLGLDETSTVQWAVFNLETNELAVENTVQLINR